MAGEAKSSSFMLGTATVMLGPQADVFNLTPEKHSIGLVKNFTMAAEPRTLDLTQGIRNTIVYSVTVEFPVKANFDVFEYTARNLAYSLSIEGFQDSYDTKEQGAMMHADLTGGVGATMLDIVVTSDISGAFKAGDWIIIQELAAGRDRVHVARLTSDGSYTAAAGGTPAYVTLLFNDHAVPTGTNFTTNARVRAMSAIGLGGNYEQPNMGMKVVGILPERNEPVTVIAPKVRITQGFNMAFTTDDYGSMPFEVSMMDLTPADPFYTLMQDYGPAMLMTGN